MFVRDLSDGLNVFNRAEEVRRLDQDAGRVWSDRALEFLQVQPAIASKTCGRKRHSLMSGVCGQNFAIFRMNAARHDNGLTAGQANGHHHGLGAGG